MNYFRKWPLQYKIAFPILSLVILAFFVSNMISFWQSSAQAERDALDLAMETTNAMANDAKVSLESGLAVAKSLSGVMLAERIQAEPSRSQAVQVFENVIAQYKGFLIGGFTGWEPDAFDKKDSEFVSKEYHDSTGRFLPYIHFAGDQIKTTVLEAYDKEGEGDGDYYLMPKKNWESHLS